jgi:hypothetical protein
MKYDYRIDVIKELVSIGIGLLAGFSISLLLVLWFFVRTESIKNRCGLGVFYSFISSWGQVKYAEDL